MNLSPLPKRREEKIIICWQTNDAQINQQKMKNTICMSGMVQD
jgi:hypothetical protein